MTKFYSRFYYQTSIKLTKLSSNQPMLSLDIYAFQYFIIIIIFYSLIVQLSAPRTFHNSSPEPFDSNS